jgi:protein-S-isoprenylcysteine O-methyltransferase Ste14
VVEKSYTVRERYLVGRVPLKELPLARIGDAALFLLWVTQGTVNTVRAVRHAREADWLAAAHVGFVATTIFVFGVLFLLRGRPTQSERKLLPRVVALIGTWSIVPLASLPLTWRPDWLLTTVNFGLIGAYVFVLWGVLTLRRNLSIFPEARQLVRHGPYALVRHPLYLGHITCYLLICLPRLSVLAVALAAVGIVGELARARNEERILSAAFPDYAAYAAVTPRFVPRISKAEAQRSPLLPDTVVVR